MRLRLVHDEDGRIVSFVPPGAELPGPAGDGERISEVEARLRQVTPGPWRRHGCDVWAEGRSSLPLLVTPRERDSSGERRAQADRDAEFVAHAVDDVRALLDELRAYRGGDAPRS